MPAVLMNVNSVEIKGCSGKITLNYSPSDLGHDVENHQFTDQNNISFEGKNIHVLSIYQSNVTINIDSANGNVNTGALGSNSADVKLIGNITLGRINVRDDSQCSLQSTASEEQDNEMEERQEETEGMEILVSKSRLKVHTSQVNRINCILVGEEGQAFMTNNNGVTKLIARQNNNLGGNLIVNIVNKEQLQKLKNSLVKLDDQISVNGLWEVWLPGSLDENQQHQGLSEFPRELVNLIGEFVAGEGHN